MTDKQVSFAELFASVKVGLERLIQQNAVEVSTDIPEDAVLFGDSDRIARALSGLLRHSIAGNPGGEIRVSAARREDVLEVVIEDSSIGVARDRLAQILKETEDTDLGASIHQAIVEQGGTATIDSRPGAATRFILTFPTGSEGAGSIPIPETALPEISPEPDAPAKRILIADNDEDVAKAVQAFLVKRGYDVAVAANGKEALIKAKATDPHMIILDVMMPDINGFDVIQVLKEDPATQHIPVMFLSILPDKDKGFRLGAVDYLVKPIREDSLLESVNAIFEKQRPGKVKKVLVVDDDRRVTMLISSRLAAEGYITRQAYNGAEAIALIARDKPDLVLLDMNMPVMDGMETLERIHANDEWSGVPVIVVTATGYADKERCINLGAAKYLTKPYIEEDLLAEVADITDQVTGGPLTNGAEETRHGG